ncbi:cytidylyltransferase domain-containing protein [Picosynechococcus sp. PCC 7117]|uniref:acylneuraminate cytidylyltransferase family protein n=1 Tax=Picosynechococcus sp. PCC 7117 TaxID=195498 RepID=UPI000810CE4C|nr:acylneuraminate cytidylyltransferase family protein [Picosynechococcus sp. PCC 7117]ANV86374.1 hypothetical protein AWQ22_02160 [Picosynechococcus sp. PCC 7117]
MRTLIIIPARAASKRIPGKNIRNLAGKPLIAWTIELAISLDNRVLVSTDSPEIAKISSQYGAEVPFLRPAELALDKTPDLPVCLHTLDFLKEKENYIPDMVVWLRPTSPLRIPEDVKQCIEKLKNHDADCIRSVCKVNHHPYWMKSFIDENRLVPFLEGKDEREYYQSQKLPPVYRLNGAVDVIRTKFIRQNKMLYGGDMQGYLMPENRSIDIDSELDFTIAEVLIRERMKGK